VRHDFAGTVERTSQELYAHPGSDRDRKGPFCRSHHSILAVLGVA
jgi:hypothetical protein